MNREFLAVGRAQVGESVATGRQLVERALRVHCAAYLAAAKAKLLRSLVLDMRKHHGPAGTLGDGSGTELASTGALDAAARADELLRLQESLRAQEKERERAQTMFIQAQRMEAVGALAGGVAHELRNYFLVLDAALAHAESLIQDEDARTELREARDVLQSATHLSGQLLELSRKRELKRKPVRINELVQRVESLLRASLPKVIAVRSTLDPDVPTIEVDGELVQQALINLGLNARDALGSSGGTLSLATGTRTVKRAPAHADASARPGRYVWLRVADSGPGIEPAALMRIFEPFYTTKPVGEGTGLGLPMVFACARSHGGWVDVTSRVGAGAAFELVLPVEAVMTDMVAASPARARSPREGLVLVVDDVDLVRRPMRRMIESMGFRVIEASDGRQAMGLVREHTDELRAVVTDLRMPELDGFGLLRELRAAGVSVPVIAVTADAATSGAADAGFSATLAKPFGPGQLERVLDEALAKH